MFAFKDLRTGDIINTLTQLDGAHEGPVITAPSPAAAAVGQHGLTLACTRCGAEHDVTDRSWRLVPAIRTPASREASA